LKYLFVELKNLKKVDFKKVIETLRKDPDSTLNTSLLAFSITMFYG